jgi:hypothetical protein
MAAPTVGKTRPRGRLTQPNSGRKKGTPNKVTQDFRETVQALLDENRENIAKWLAIVAQGSPAVFDRKGNIVRQEKVGDPSTALLRLSYLAEFAAPKLNRTEVTGDGGGPLTVVVNTLASPE